jgi:hypothetical protein
MKAPESISPEDMDLLRRLAARVAELRMETPAILTLETARPVSLVAGQASAFDRLVRASRTAATSPRSPKNTTLTPCGHRGGRRGRNTKPARTAVVLHPGQAFMTSLPGDIRSILATDCGSTTTKAILIERGPDGYRLRVRGEAPTTVEAPFEDVTRGVLNAVREVEELCGRRLLDGDRIVSPQQGDVGVDLYLSTSSAGGGLQMMVTGLVKQMTGESAQRAALGAGAIVMDVMALNDGRRPTKDQLLANTPDSPLGETDAT